MSTPLALPRPPTVVALPPTTAAPPKESEYVVRFDVHQRVQHVLMASSFTVLALTGLPQKFEDLALSQWAIAAMGGLDSVRAIHHIAAVVMLADCAYHALYLVWQLVVLRRRSALSMVATLQDLRDIWRTLLWFLGLSRKRPEFDRFTYLEKFDYWAVFWGIAIIGGSGLILLFPVVAAKLMPGAIIPVAFVAHSDEAVLAVGWIVVVHFFYAHLSPRAFPFDRTIFTGTMRRTAALRHHPRWIARLTEDGSKGG